ncbi:diacylglycerol kinase [Desulfosarcina ovata subsp. sediminis]|uniref:Diacylglycerol kinase n=1 Tax=Desulfosarcina ovata subsp. sediminis TaxID=885957 RepID=A0A5K7ZQ38_9BACT|nr:diacylglycerol kinase family protein [Desulfosarcina ovata]BBO81420.1 diacylglycerol kinase [Desulfosarcina ovata subsp. sediminis]
MSPPPHYCMIANPASGKLSANRRYARLQQVARMMKATVRGLDTGNARELAQCAREAAQECDVLVVAGGDGTFSLMLNAVDLATTTLAFLPFGTGNALTHALGYGKNLLQIAAGIIGGRDHRLDLIDCGTGCDVRQKAFMTSLGIDGAAIRRYEQFRARGYRGLKAHMAAGVTAYFRDYRPTGGQLTIDGRHKRIDHLLSLMVVKQPYFGMGLKAVPRARWNDGRLHIQAIDSGLAGALTGLITGFSIGNRAGRYRCGHSFYLRLDTPLTLQVDGEVGWTSDRFDFRVLPGVLKLRY